MNSHVIITAKRTGDAVTAITHVLNIARASKITIDLDMGQGILLAVRHDSNSIDLATIYDLTLENITLKKRDIV